MGDLHELIDRDLKPDYLDLKIKISEATSRSFVSLKDFIRLENCVKLVTEGKKFDITSFDLITDQNAESVDEILFLILKGKVDERRTSEAELKGPEMEMIREKVDNLAQSTVFV